jgi:hypothetical protein
LQQLAPAPLHERPFLQVSCTCRSIRASASSRPIVHVTYCSRR